MLQRHEVIVEKYLSDLRALFYEIEPVINLLLVAFSLLLNQQLHSQPAYSCARAAHIDCIYYFIFAHLLPTLFNID